MDTQKQKELELTEEDFRYLYNRKQYTISQTSNFIEGMLHAYRVANFITLEEYHTCRSIYFRVWNDYRNDERNR